MIARGIVPKSPGVAHWSIGALTKHESLRNDLLAGPYKEEALVPESPWLDKKAPHKPTAAYEDRGNDLYVKWTAKNEKEVFKYVIYTQYGEKWTYRTLNARSSFFQVPKQIEANPKTKAMAKLKAIKVTAVGRTGNESDGEIITL